MRVVASHLRAEKGRGSATTLLVAAEAYGVAEWHLRDDSVVALAGLGVADDLAWIPGRTSWRSTEARPPRG